MLHNWNNFHQVGIHFHQFTSRQLRKTTTTNCKNNYNVTTPYFTSIFKLIDTRRSCNMVMGTHLMIFRYDKNTAFPRQRNDIFPSGERHLKRLITITIFTVITMVYLKDGNRLRLKTISSIGRKNVNRV